MKRLIIISAVALAVSLSASAQKKPLDHSVYDSWESVTGMDLSDNGGIFTYVVSKQEGDSRLVIKNRVTGQSISIERGGTAQITRDGKWAFFTIKAPFADTRAAKIAKKKADEMPKDSLGYVNLETFELAKIADVTSFKLAGEKSDLVLYMPKAKEKEAKCAVIFNPATGQRDSLKHIDQYVFDKAGNRLAATFKKDKKDSLSVNEVALFELGTMDRKSLSKDLKYYSTPVFNEAGDKLTFLASADSNDTGNKHCALWLYEDIVTGKGKKAVKSSRIEEIIPQDYSLGKLCLTENSSPSFSKSSGRIVLGIAECMPPKDTTIVEFESAQLDIWNYDIYLTPPMQKANLDRLKKATVDAVINLSNPHVIVPLADNVFENFIFADGADVDYALSVDDRPYQISSTWDSNDYCDVALVNLADGSRKNIFTKLNGGASLSPSGKYIYWYSNDDLGWHTYRISDGRELNITGAAGVPFYDDEDDHPMVPPYYDRPHWMENDEAFVISDKYDIWKFNADGKGMTCLTQGRGRKENLQLSLVTIAKDDTYSALRRLGASKTIGKKDLIYLTVYDRTTKENGYATVAADKPGIISFNKEKHSFLSPVKARNAEVFAYRMGDFSHSADAYLVSDLFGTREKQSSINPQQEQYNWGVSQLVHWTAYDGTKLDGILITPEDLDPNKKYPMMIYFYEKYSESLYNYVQPAPSRSTVNWSFFASRGYVVFVPDIVYKDGHPGESAYNCVCSGAEAMCEQFKFIDKDRMGIQGQSWGGYQTAYLVTRTDMFAAAGAGAPVGNMTSAYGGIRWESGLVRAMQYEHGQSRIGKSLWDEGGLDLYIENSPIFHADKCTTPTLIMHNDADGAVPWYQGIEFFMSLRRFGNPAWLLQYNNEAHNLNERRNSKDLSIRLQQFFDHYLKGDPMPAWMRDGVPMTRKGQYYGYELSE